ncbi:hypothetical protein [Cryptosporangium minutisporangium]|uniref:Uncharacterized protein n=1 Tax=Cryptosporangium minutisporangium TaxID=113569 RepID=A0ABP6SW29_9ACTN
MPHSALTVVCLPAGVSTSTPLAAAEAALAATPPTVQLDSLGSAAHFLARPRRRCGFRVRSAQRVTPGGPVGQLDLDTMRTSTYQRYAYRWAIWNQVVASTRPAQPYWTFLDRHAAGPDRYPLEQAQQDYLTQQRVLAMRTYNALPHRAIELPTSHLEAFQLGPQGYAHLGWLSAVPGDRLLCPDGTYLACETDQLSARLDYLTGANQHLTAMREDDVLVALRTH